MENIENIKAANVEGMPRREFIKKSLIGSGGLFIGMTMTEGIITPLLTRNINPSTASSTGGHGGCNNGVGNGADCLPPGLEKNGKGDELDNDDNGGTPGNPQSQGGNNGNGGNSGTPGNPQSQGGNNGNGGNSGKKPRN